MSDTINTYNPATGEKLDHYHLMSADDAEQAVTRSQEAYLNWRRTSFDARAQLFNNLADLMEERIDDLTSLMTREMGKVAEQGRQEVQLCAAYWRDLRYSALEFPPLSGYSLQCFKHYGG